MREVFIARHGERIDSVTPGWTLQAESPYDPYLAPEGLAQADALGERLKEAGITRIVASPFTRTLETATAVADALDLPIQLLPDLGEWLYKDWFATKPKILSGEEISKRFPRVLSVEPPLLDLAYPETSHDLAERVKRVKGFVEGLSDDRVLLVSHGIVITWIVHEFVPEVYIRPWEVQTCSLAMVRKDDNGAKWNLGFKNDTTHLREVAAKKWKLDMSKFVESRL